MNELKINHGATIVSIIFLQMLGFLWYGTLFVEQWMKMVGLTMADAEANPPGAGVWITMVFSSALAVYVLAWLFTKLNVTSAVSGLSFGVIIAIAFYFLPIMSGNMFAQAPYGLAWIDGGFQVVGWGVAGLILGAWRKTA